MHFPFAAADPIGNIDPTSGVADVAKIGSLTSLLATGSMLALLLCTAVVIVGGGTWAFGARGGHMGGVTWGRGMVLSGFAGAFVIGAAAAIVNVGFGLGT